MLTTGVQMIDKIAAKRLPPAALCLLGSGTMQWSKDKQIDVSQGTSHRFTLLCCCPSCHLLCCHATDPGSSIDDRVLVLSPEFTG